MAILPESCADSCSSDPSPRSSALGVARVPVPSFHRCVALIRICGPPFPLPPLPSRSAPTSALAPAPTSALPSLSSCLSLSTFLLFSPAVEHMFSLLFFTSHRLLSLLRLRHVVTPLHQISARLAHELLCRPFSFAPRPTLHGFRRLSDFSPSWGPSPLGRIFLRSSVLCLHMAVRFRPFFQPRVFFTSSFPSSSATLLSHRRACPELRLRPSTQRSLRSFSDPSFPLTRCHHLRRLALHTGEPTALPHLPLFPSNDLLRHGASRALPLCMTALRLAPTVPAPNAKASLKPGPLFHSSPSFSAQAQAMRA